MHLQAAPGSCQQLPTVDSLSSDTEAPRGNCCRPTMVVKHKCTQLKTWLALYRLNLKSGSSASIIVLIINVAHLGGCTTPAVAGVPCDMSGIEEHSPIAMLWQCMAQSGSNSGRPGSACCTYGPMKKCETSVPQQAERAQMVLQIISIRGACILLNNAGATSRPERLSRVM